MSSSWLSASNRGKNFCLSDSIKQQYMRSHARVLEPAQVQWYVTRRRAQHFSFAERCCQSSKSHRKSVVTFETSGPAAVCTNFQVRGYQKQEQYTQERDCSYVKKLL